MIEISIDLDFRANGRFYEDDERLQNFRGRVKALINGYKDLSKKYLESLSDDGKITGQEKHELIDSLEAILMIALMIRKHDFLKKEFRVIIVKSKGKFIVEINFIDRLNWSMSGTIRPEYKIKIKNFKHWFNGVFSDSIKKFIQIYNIYAEDRHISSEEKQLLAEQLDRITIEIIEMVVYIERFMHFK